MSWENSKASKLVLRLILMLSLVFKPRPILFTLKSKVEYELDKLLSDGVISLVEKSKGLITINT